MAGSAGKDKDRNGAAKAVQALARIQRSLLDRLADYVIENEVSLRRASEGVEGYGYTVHQIDELFLHQLNLIERAVAELQKSPSAGANRYRSLCFRAPSQTVEEEINLRLEKIPDARVLGVSVSPAGPSAGAPAGAPPAGGRDGEDATWAAGPVEGLADGPASGGDDLLVAVLYYGPRPASADV